MFSTCVEVEDRGFGIIRVRATQEQWDHPLARTPMVRDCRFDHAATTNQATRELRALGAAQAVLHENDQGQDAAEGLATEIGANIGEPCSRCGCMLFYLRSVIATIRAG